MSIRRRIGLEGIRTLHMLHSLDAEVGKLASTVRRGFKWADLQMDDHLILCVCTPKEHVPEGLPADFDAKHDEQGRGLVKQLWFGYFSDIPARFLQYEHEERSRTYDGLFESMQYAYGQDFNENSPVTVVVYKRVR